MSPIHTANRLSPRPQLIILVLAASLVASLLSLSHADEIPTATPESVGFSSERLNRVTEVGQAMVDAGQVAGIITQVARRGKVIHTDVIGARGVDDPTPLQQDDLFRIYSMTKPVTAVAAMILYEEGKFHLRDPVSKFVPQLADLKVLKDGRYVPVENEMTMHHLLTHTAGLSYGFVADNPVDVAYQEAELWEGDLDDFADKLGKLPLKFEPGVRYHYSVAVDVTGVVVERLSGLTFDEFLRTRLFEPLDMPDTFFSVPQEERDRFLPLHYWDPETNMLATIPETDADFTQRYFDTKLFSGGGGLVSTARDYLRFSEMMLRGGELDGVRILSPKTVHFMRQDHMHATSSEVREGTPAAPPYLRDYIGGFGFGLGFGVTTDPASIQYIGSAGEYFWGGAGGTGFWIDPSEDLSVVFMIQLFASPWPLGPDLHVAVYQALEESNLN